MILKKVKSFKEFKEELLSNPKLQTQFQKDPVKTINKIEEKNPLKTDQWIYRIVVIGLSITIISIIIGVLVLIGSGKITDVQNVPTILTAIGSAAIGALAGLLVPPPQSDEAG